MHRATFPSQLVANSAANEYNGLHWRTVKRSDTSAAPNGLDQQSIMYYDASWRMVEERVDDNWTSSSSTVDRHMQNLWGTRYIDDLIARRRDADKNGNYTGSNDATFYAVSDVQFSVVAMLTSTGKLHERVRYDSYGTAGHHWKDDVDGDGDVDSSDKSAVTALLNKAIYQSGYNPAADIDRSGTIDSADATLVSSKAIAALAAGLISDRTSTGPDNTVGYDGYVFNPENLLYTVRFRHYDTGLGRWLERDPAGYVDGLSLYQFVRGSPIARADSTGLWEDPRPFPVDDDGNPLPHGPRPLPHRRWGIPDVVFVSCNTTPGDLESWKKRHRRVVPISPKKRHPSGSELIAQHLESLSECVHTVYVSGHGCGGGVSFGREPCFNHREAEAILRRIGARLCRDAAVILCSCDAGKGKNWDGLQDLANKLGATVWACDDLCSSPCECDGNWKRFDPQ